MQWTMAIESTHVIGKRSYW